MDKNIKNEVEYCINCKNKPCKNACPLQNDIPLFIKLLKEEKYKGAYEVLCDTTVLPSICGRICPHSKQCQGSCTRGIKSQPVQIGKIESYIADMAIKEKWNIQKTSNILEGKKVAVVGSGPSSLTCAAYLAKNGCKVTIFERYSELGGLLYYGIPEFRLDKRILKESIDKILELGIDVVKNYSLDINKLEKEYDAIYLGIGANISASMGIPGENLDGVYGGNELLENKNFPNFKGKRVAVIGGGNVAMDVSRTIKRLGADKVYVIYRRSREQMPAEDLEVKEAINEEIEFLFQNNIVSIIGDKKVEKIECIKTELVKKENDSRLSPVNIEGSNYTIDMDYVIMAVGSKADEKTISSLGVDTDKFGKIKIDENNMTSREKVFAGGDVISQKATVAWAAISGREAANSIIKYLRR